MAQQAKPNVIGQMLDCRPQLIACSSVVVITPSSRRPSIHGCTRMFWFMVSVIRVQMCNSYARPNGNRLSAGSRPAALKTSTAPSSKPCDLFLPDQDTDKPSRATGADHVIDRPQ